MTGENLVTFRHRGTELTFDVLESCAVSDYLREHANFYELGFLDALGTMLEPDALVLDVGAHIGNHTVYFAKVLGVDVWAFEPNPEAFEKLERNVGLNGVEGRVRLFNVALSDQVGDVRMEPAAPEDAGTMSIAEVPAGGSAIVAHAQRLDDIAVPEGRQLFIKIDVEGHEPNVIRGARALLDERRPELSVEARDVAHFDEIVSALDSRYVPTDMFNATPTLVFAVTSEIEPERQLHMARYGVAAAVDYQQRRNWYQAEKARADSFAGQLVERSGQVSTLREMLAGRNDEISRIANAAANRSDVAQDQPTIPLVKRVARLRDDSRMLRGIQEIGLDGEYPQLARDVEAMRLFLQSSEETVIQRVMIVRFGGPPIAASLISLAFGSVDMVDCDPDLRAPIRLRRFVDGRKVQDIEPAEGFGENELGAAAVLAHLREHDAEAGPIGVVALVGGAESPELESAFQALIEARYVVVAHDATYSFARLMVLTGAAAVALDTPDELASWNRAQIIPAEPIEQSSAALAELMTTVARSDVRPPIIDPVQADSRVLLVSYYAPPATPVSVQRLDYWHKHLSEIAGEGGFSADIRWLTATYQALGRDNTLVVSDRGKWSLSDRWFEMYDHVSEVGLDPQGITWSHYVEQQLDELRGPYSTVLLSGNPFHYFALGPVFRDRWGSRIILDFRDPYAYNTRFNFTVEQRELAIKLESEWVSEADAVVSVNEFCLESVAPAVDVERLVVANGYDESVIEGANPREKQLNPTWIAYSGTVFANLPIDDLLDALPSDRLQLVHFGRDYSANQAVKDHEGGIARGLVPYSQLVSELTACSAGLIMTTGEPSTQTTKLFDYIACDLDIIIVTSGRPKTGNLHEITRDLDGVFWVRNNPKDLRKFFNRYEPTGVHRPQRGEYSRRHQTSQLFDLIQKVEKK